MARQVRIQFPGATYHIMSRGNRKEPIVISDQDRKVFIDTLGHACKRTGWRIHTYVLMINHYHMLLETPEANLVDGMKWFQSTYAHRFNIRNKRVGHLFQGRYKALLIDVKSSTYFIAVSNYIHLNPARAGLLNHQNPNLSQYRWSSYPQYLRPQGARPAWLDVDKVFQELNISEDNASGRRKYADYMTENLLQFMNSEKSMHFQEKWEKIRHGWYLGDNAFKEELLNRAGIIFKGKNSDSYTGDSKRQHNEKAAEELTQQALNILAVEERLLKRMKKNNPVKQVAAWLLKINTTASNNWIASRLCMGHRNAVSNAVKQVKEEINWELTVLKKKIIKRMQMSD